MNVLVHSTFTTGRDAQNIAKGLLKALECMYNNKIKNQPN